MIKELSIDLETYSDVDISKCGAYKYAESDHFEILLVGVSVDNDPVVVYDLTAGDEIPTEILEMHYDLVSLYGPTALTGRCWCSPESSGSENEGRQGLNQIFCRPCKPTKANGGRTRNLPEHAPDKWGIFKSYNHRDVEAELSIKQRLSKFPVPDSIWNEYQIDQEINDGEIMLDMDVMKNAIAFKEKSKAELMIAMQNAICKDGRAHGIFQFYGANRSGR